METNKAQKIFDQLVRESAAANPACIGDGIVYLTAEKQKELGIDPVEFVDEVMEYAEEKGYEPRFSFDAPEGGYDSDFLVSDPVVFYRSETLEKTAEKLEEGKGPVFVIREQFADGYVLRGLVHFDMCDDELVKYGVLFKVGRSRGVLRHLHPGIVCEAGSEVALHELSSHTSAPESDIFIWLLTEHYRDFEHPLIPVIRLSEHRDTLDSMLAKMTEVNDR